jgi:hypothetical protein
MQISPGNTQKYTIRQMVGVRTKTKELALALGFGHIGRTGLAPQISSRIETSVTFDEEHEVTQEVAETNDRSGYYRRVAFWYVQHELAVDALIASSAVTSSPTARLRVSSGLRENQHRSSRRMRATLPTRMYPARALVGGDHRGTSRHRIPSRSGDPDRAAEGSGAVPAAGHQASR